ncbi:MAG TPA: tetratricopeptide repeat protein [Gemmatimonadales bacterium]|nr:tetratricopeptide repeat protein [Gemmatimonadales bacterium]
MYDQARSARSRGQLDSAWDLIQRAAEAEPNRAEVQFLLGDLACSRAQQASAFSAFGLARKCKAGFARAAALAPDNLEYVASFASYLAQAPGIVGGDRDSAQKLIALVRSRDEVRGVFLQAGLWLEGNAAAKERADSIVDALGKARAGERQTQLRVAGWWDGTRRPERALAVYQAMAVRDPNDAVAHFYVGRELVLLKRNPREAQDHLRFAAAATVPAPGSNAPTFVPGAPWYRLGQTYVQLGMSDSARLCFRRALEVNPQLDAARASLDSLTHH